MVQLRCALALSPSRIQLRVVVVYLELFSCSGGRVNLYKVDYSHQLQTFSMAHALLKADVRYSRSLSLNSMYIR